MPELEDVRWGQARRFEFIEWRAYWAGRVNRSDLEDRFGVSTPQASVDLRTYQELAPDNIFYDATEKAYLPTAAFEPKFLKISADRYLRQLEAILNTAIQVGDTWFGSPPPVSVMQTVVRQVEPETLRRILRAIDRQHQVEIEYLSLTNTRKRAIAPHSLAYDGHRWHARAWCAEHRDFRDFVLTRILSIGDGGASAADPTNDMEWNTRVDLNVIAHPDLDPPQRSAIERDYGMEEGRLVIRTRAALAFYLIKRLNLDLDSATIPPARKQIFLTNLAQVELAQAEAKEQTRRLVAKVHIAEA